MPGFQELRRFVRAPTKGIAGPRLWLAGDFWKNRLSEKVKVSPIVDNCLPKANRTSWNPAFKIYLSCLVKKSGCIHYSFFLQHSDYTVFFTSFKELMFLRGRPTSAIYGPTPLFFDN
jgi:hypothetical protein